MTTCAAPTDPRPRPHATAHLLPTVATLSLGALVSLAACTTERAATEGIAGPVPTIDVGPTVAPTAPPAPAPAPTQPPPAATAPSPPPAPTTTQPPTTTTTAPPTFFVQQLDFYHTRYESTGGGINPQNAWSLDSDEPRVQVATLHGPLATAEAAEVRAMIYSSFQPRSSEATITWDVTWSGYATSFVGADSSAKATVTIRVYEIIPGTETATIGPTIFEQVVAEDGVGSALQGVATLRMDASDSRSAVLPPLDLAKFYRLEAELECSSRVAFSVGTTWCDFVEEPASGLTVNSWSIRFDNVPAS
jgi:hypothetical protein